MIAVQPQGPCQLALASGPPLVSNAPHAVQDRSFAGCPAGVQGVRASVYAPYMHTFCDWYGVEMQRLCWTSDNPLWDGGSSSRYQLCLALHELKVDNPIFAYPHRQGLAEWLAALNVFKIGQLSKEND
eukprot:1147041-Pelagomonas_calceolata.AAC.6